MIKLKRVYEPPATADGARFLVDRLWPRGVKKDGLRIDAWVKDVAPSPELRAWFGHDPAKWEAFRVRYFRELDGTPDACGGLLEAARRGDVTLLFSARDPERNNAVALRDYLQSRLRRRRGAR